MAPQTRTSSGLDQYFALGDPIAEFPIGAKFRDVLERKFNTNLPQMITKKLAEATRDITKVERAWASKRQLHYAVYDPGMVDDAIRALRADPTFQVLENTPVDANNASQYAFVKSLDPTSPTFLSSQSRSEADHVDHFVLRVCRYLRFLRHYAKYTNKSHKCPELGSDSAKGIEQILADRVLRIGSDVVVIVELKSGNSLNPEIFKSLYDAAVTLGGLFDGPFPIPFYWKSTEETGSLDKTSRMLSQVRMVYQPYLSTID